MTANGILGFLREPGVLTIQTPDGPRLLRSEPQPATALAYNPFKDEPGAAHGRKIGTSDPFVRFDMGDARRTWRVPRAAMSSASAYRQEI